jgi:hypothetical protein
MFLSICSNIMFLTLQVLQWLRSLTPHCPWYPSTCAVAAKGGFTEILQWLRTQNPPCPWDEQSTREVVRGGHLSLLKWMRAQNPPLSLGHTRGPNCCTFQKTAYIEVAAGAG